MFLGSIEMEHRPEMGREYIQGTAHRNLCCRIKCFKLYSASVDVSA